jgi:phytoene dehydrogenase-like protein
VIETGRRIERLDELPPARAVLFDTSPDQLASIAGDALPASYRRRLARYRYGPGAFKVDWALDGPIPWRDPTCREASTVHVGGTLEEICASERDMYAGRHSERPVPDPVPAERDRSDARARRQAHGLCLLPRPARLDGRSHRGDRGADRALRAGLPRPHPRAPRDEPRLVPALQPQLRRRRDHRRRRRRAPALQPPVTRSIPTPRPTRACSSAPPPRRPAAACTGSVATGQHSRCSSATRRVGKRFVCPPLSYTRPSISLPTRSWR